MIDVQNEKAYDYHYINLDSTEIIARRVISKRTDYVNGNAEAYNNLAFVSIAKMNYDLAKEQLDTVIKMSNSQIELLIADVQMMRLCQRKSSNKDFYLHKLRAQNRIKRLDIDSNLFSKHEKKRIVYAKTEYAIVASTYFYYVGLDKESTCAMELIGNSDEIYADTAQLINYFYNIGSGGVIQCANKEETQQKEFEYLIQCYTLAVKYGYVFFEANALQALSEHMMDSGNRDRLHADNMVEFSFLNFDDMPDSLLAGNLAWHALENFKKYGDVYQVAGAYRTLAECYWHINDYSSALVCLNKALNINKAIQQAPDLVASIREQLSLTYSAMDQKQNSDYNRNIYLDLQEKTRQDRLYEARLSMIEQSAKQQNIMIVAVMLMIILVVGLLFVFDRKWRKNLENFSFDNLLIPLKEWKDKRLNDFAKMDNEYCEAKEKLNLEQMQLLKEKRRNLEHRAKVSLSNSIVPYIDGMKNEVDKLSTRNEDDKIRQERFKYIGELSNKITECNGILTNWIQMKQGLLSLYIESFLLQSLFDIVHKEQTEFKQKKIQLTVENTDLVIKADRALTLFMINTILDNSKKFTNENGKVSLYAKELPDGIEVNIVDSGIGMSEEMVKQMFEHSSLTRKSANDTYKGGHGFGLMNCKGIIEKYKKISSIFNVCDIGVESKLGKGSRFYFILPKGLMCLFVVLQLSLVPLTSFADNVYLEKARQFADSTYFSNLKKEYRRTLAFADSSFYYLNEHHKLVQKNDRNFLLLCDEANRSSELVWFDNNVRTNYSTILDVRNEVAVAALALHNWKLYKYNNSVYNSLFRKNSADKKLPEYVRIMEKSKSNKTISIILLTILLLCIFPIYYYLYYRKQLLYKFCLDKIKGINDILFSNKTEGEMIVRISNLWNVDIKDIKFNDNFATLEAIVNNILNTLKQNETEGYNKMDCIEEVNDECRRIKMEKDKFHVSNSVLDNCLSSLKHETMYYPTRINHMIHNESVDMKALGELLSYYKELYSILVMQSARQIENHIGMDKNMVDYLFELIKEITSSKKWTITVDEDVNQKYVNVVMCISSYAITKEQAANLFSLQTKDVRFLTCKQIIREIGDEYGARKCGIKAYLDSKGDTVISIFIVKQLWESLK